MSRFLTIPSNNNIRKRKIIPNLKLLSIGNLGANNNQFYKETISSINKKYSSRELSAKNNISKKTEEEYNEIEVKKHQQNFLYSLLSKNKSHKLIEFDKYNSVLNKSLEHYKSKGITDEEIKYKNKIKNDLSQNKQNINNTEQNIKKKVFSKNRFKININIPNYKNPFQSLNVINDNNSVFNQISKEVLVRQRNLYDKTVESLEGNLKKFNIKMPKIKVSNLNPKIKEEIAMINLINNEENKNSNMFPIIPNSGDLKLFSYFRYPNKNFPEGRLHFSLCIKENRIIISGGLSSTMKTMQLWSLNIENLQWNKIHTSNTTNCRYGHTSTYFQNKIYYFGGITKEDNIDVLAGLEIYNFSENSFTVPEDLINPKKRRNHISCMIGGQILFHGGVDSDNEILNDILLLNLNPLKWLNPIINNYLPMPKVYGHSACLVIPTKILLHYKFNIYRFPDEDQNDKSVNKIKERGLYIFGGKTKDEGGLSNDLWVLVLGQKPIHWNKVKTFGTPPCPRYYHSMDYFEKSNFLIIHGGRNDIISSSSALDDTFVLDLTNLGWVKIELYSNIPDFRVFSRYGHKSAIISNKLIILGGANNNNYIGSSLFIVNLDFSYTNQQRSIQEIMMKELKGQNNFEARQKLVKLKNELKKMQLGLVTKINLPAIK